MSDAALLLEVLRDAAVRGDDLEAALSASGLRGCERVAARLRQGATLPEAVAGLVPPRLARWLAGGVPPLATVAALLADEAWRQEERRHLLVDHLAYPAASCAMVACIGGLTWQLLPPGPWYAPLVSPCWALLPAALALALLVAPWLPRSWRMPGSGWVRHLDQASCWARAALAVQWRLTEDQALRLLGTDLSPLAMVLGTPGSEAHCRLLAHWHQRAARRSLGLTSFAAAALILAAGGGLVLASLRMWTGHPA